MCKIKYSLFLKKISTLCFDDYQDLIGHFFKIDLKLMNLNKIKKNSTSEIKEKLKQSKFEVLTNEKDFLVKNLKKAG